MTDTSFFTIREPAKSPLGPPNASSNLDSASWSPDGRRIADSTGRICTVSKGGREITPTGFQPRQHDVLSVAWNPDGKRLASSGFGSVVRLWDADGTPGPLLQTNAAWIGPSPGARMECGWLLEASGQLCGYGTRTGARGRCYGDTEDVCNGCRLESGRKAAGLGE